MLSRTQIHMSPVRMACIALALVSTISTAHASSGDAWEEFRDAVREKCTALAGKSMTVSNVQIDPYGSDAYGIAILTGREQGADQEALAVCIFNKQTQEVEIGSMMPKEANKAMASSVPQCEIFSGAGFQGAQGVIVADDMVRFQPESESGKSLSGIGAKRVFFDASWLDNIGSVKTSSACVLMVWDQTDLKAPPRPYRGEHAAMDAAAGGKVGAAFCECQK